MKGYKESYGDSLRYQKKSLYMIADLSNVVVVVEDNIDAG